MKISVTDLAGVAHEIDAEPGLSLMEAIRDAELPILALCGGCCSCSTCHVYVDADWTDKIPAISEEEEDTLDQAVDLRENSRLSCQIRLSELLNGLTVTLSEDTRLD